jgi:hypothetical protein
VKAKVLVQLTGEHEDGARLVEEGLAAGAAVVAGAGVTAGAGAGWLF